MSAIRERCVLYLIDLPKKLTSRRNLHAHFSQFGEIKNVSVNKEQRTSMIEFSTHFAAQSAKTQGNIYEGESLNILWSRSPRDPREKARQEPEAMDSDTLWQEDDKECFGVEPLIVRDKRKPSAKDMIKQHLKTSGVKKRLGAKVGDEIKSQTLQKSPVKIIKVGNKPLVTRRKSLVIQGQKQGVMKREGEPPRRSVSDKLKKISLPDEKTFKSSSNFEQTSLKSKLSILDERDKVIRKGLVQETNIKNAIIIKGTCPDMCPERERILRQVGHAVATYEMITGTYDMDENKAVKEYIRSSADQEVPLAHDLRPGPVLSMTMDYLITNIINRVDNPDENKAVWYSFCWNRLRSIRKDIILQQLCDLETVKIVEQCARFHICCYDHMWGADIGGFDDKINTQNLIDCLQTLRHMYEDLAKHNVTCPNEPEFYSYLILLRLKSGDLMWEYQHYSLRVQFSPHVQFAIKAYMAFKHNMYSKYFSLVKEASYLTACLMQRYFDEVRAHALKIMLKAYCLPAKTVGHPTSIGVSPSFIVSSLKFDSQKNALRFCELQYVDLKAEDSGGEQDIYVSTSSFLIREKRLPISNVVVGENEPLPVYVPHEVQSSFDELGRLKTTLHISLDEDELDMSGGSFYTNEDKSDINISEVEFEEPTFKFSLSPTKSPENSFNDSLFSNKDLHKFSQASVIGISSEIKHFDTEVQGPSKSLFTSNNTYGIGTVEQFEMEHDFNQEIKSEDLDIVASTDEKMLLPQTNIFKMPQPNSQNPFMIKLSSEIKPNVLFCNQGNEAPFFTKNYDSPLKNAGNIKTSNDNFKENVKFSFTINKSDETIESYSEKLSNLSQTNTFNPVKNSEKLFKFDVPQQNLFNDDNKIKNMSHTHSVHMGFDFPQEVLKQSGDVSKNSTEGNLNELEDIAAMREALLLEKKKKELAEEERRKVKEMERLEMEELRRKIKRKELNALRKDVSQRMKAKNARKYARHWKKKVEKLKETRMDFPMLVQLSVKNHLLLWGSANSIPTQKLYQRAIHKINFTRVTSDLLKSGITTSYKFIGSDLAESLAKSAIRTMYKGVIKPVYWKLAFSVPWINPSCSDVLPVFNQLMRRWCRQAFYRRENANFGSVEYFMTSLEVPVNISVHFVDDDQSTHNLKAMDALVFVVLNEPESEKLCLQRLRSIATFQGKNGEFSVAVMNIGGNKFERVLKLELEELHQQNLIAHWTIRTWSSPDSIIKSLNYLTEHINVVPYILASTLEMLVKQVSEDFFDALSSGQHYCKELSEAMKTPNNIVILYNTCLIKLENLLMSSKLEKYFNFAEEFKANVPLKESGGPELMCGKQFNNLYKAQISDKLNALKLPEFSIWPPKSPDHLVKMLKSYCSQVHDVGVFSQIFRMIDLLDECDLQQHLEQVPWLKIVEMWSQCCIRHLFSNREQLKKILVIFDRHDVQRLIEKRWWLKHPLVAYSN